MRHATIILLATLALTMFSQSNALNLVLETFVNDNGALTLAAQSLGGNNFEASVSLAGEPSVCNIDMSDGVLHDTFYMKFHPTYDITRSARATSCQIDLRVLLQGEFDTMCLAFDRLVFSKTPPTKAKTWLPCQRNSTHSSLCALESTSAVSIITGEKVSEQVSLLLFADKRVRNELIAGATLGNDIYLVPDKTWANTIERVMTIPISDIVESHTMCYSVSKHSISLFKSTPTRAMRTVCAFFVGLISFIFAGRVLVVDPWRFKKLKALSIVICIVAIFVSFGAQTRSLADIGFIGVIFIALIFYIAMELGRSPRNKRVFDRLSLQPDVAIVMLAQIVSFYAIATHSMLVIPVLLVIVFGIRSVSQLVTSKDTSNEMFKLGTFANILTNVALWRYVVAEFVFTNTEGLWLLQVAFIMLLIANGGLFMKGFARNVFSIV